MSGWSRPKRPTKHGSAKYCYFFHYSLIQTAAHGDVPSICNKHSNNANGKKTRSPGSGLRFARPASGCFPIHENKMTNIYSVSRGEWANMVDPIGLHRARPFVPTPNPPALSLVQAHHT